MPRKSRRELSRLPQTAETWQVAIPQLRMWITPENQPPVRPYAVFIFSMESGLLMNVELVEAAPTPEQMRDILFKTMAQPVKAAGPARRPQWINIPGAKLAEALALAFAEAGLEVAIQDMQAPEEIADVVRDFETHMNGRPELPGLLSVQGVTPDLLAGLFAAAAEFYRAAPWVHLTNDQIVALRHPAEPNYRYVIVMGNGGVEYGLATYGSWADVEHQFDAVDSLMDAIPKAGVHSMLFDKVTLLPFDDLEAIQQYGWEVAGENAYPLPVIVERETGARRPELIDLLWYEAALRVIPILVRDHLLPDGLGDYQPVETSIEAMTHAGPIQVGVKYPGGQFSLEARPAQEIDLSDLEADLERDDELGESDEFDESDEPAGAMPFFDRRGMEGMLYDVAAGMSGRAGPDNETLDRAQQVMYRAWNDPNPAKRIALAHEALSISADCTDAYVLLAEEEAGTVGRALDLYRQGVEAGERALGEDYFENAAGHFWGILETRPYMRARKGLADTLWRLNRKDEAMAQYYDMLRLNEGDNQGVRYLLLDLLLQLDRDKDATQLLHKYGDEWSAVWKYSQALLEFRKTGASDKASRAMAGALEQNPHVPPYLMEKKRIPNALPDYVGMGDEAEAVAYAADHLNHWRRTPGAVEWLVAQMNAAPARPKTRPAARPKPKQARAHTAKSKKKTSGAGRAKPKGKAK
jgi:tetratricopeptide (TPR) repeat protein